MGGSLRGGDQETLRAGRWADTVGETERAEMKEGTGSRERESVWEWT